MKKRVDLDLIKVINEIIDIQKEIEARPALTDLDKIKFEQTLDIEQLYYSSAMEGSQLNVEGMRRATHDGKELQAA